MTHFSALIPTKMMHECTQSPKFLLEPQHKITPDLSLSTVTDMHTCTPHV